MNAKFFSMTSKISTSVLWKIKMCFINLNLMSLQSFLVHLLGSLIAVIISLNPFESVPQLSVLYLNVIWFVLVKRMPTLCFVFRQDMSIYKKNIVSRFNCMIKKHFFVCDKKYCAFFMWEKWNENLLWAFLPHVHHHKHKDDHYSLMKACQIWKKMGIVIKITWK